MLKSIEISGVLWYDVCILKKEKREQMSLEEALRKIQILELENENVKLENNSLKRIIFGSKR